MGKESWESKPRAARPQPWESTRAVRDIRTNDLWTNDLPPDHRYDSGKVSRVRPGHNRGKVREQCEIYGLTICQRLADMTVGK